jgi:putative ABC transport system permease protein
MLSVAFGVMSLIGMTMLSEAIFDVLLIDPRREIGGDAELSREGRYLSGEDLARIEGYVESGEIAQWTRVADTDAILLKRIDSGQVTFLRSSVGVEPDRYPLVGDLKLRSGALPAEVLRNPGDVIVTRDLADDLELVPGDTVLVGSQLGGEPQAVRVVGVAVQTPSMWGTSLYYSLDTASMLTGHPRPVTAVNVIWGEGGEEARATLAEDGWRVSAPDTLPQARVEMRAMFNLMLKGSGILGLMVGGIGIANTMQVLLRRRREEVGVLKTLGYARRDIMLLFVLETALIGFVGSLLGAAAGVVLSVLLTQVASNVVTLFLTWKIRAGLIVGGIAVGLVTTILFAVNAILQAADVRPSDVFRQLPISARGAGRRRKMVRSLFTFGAMAVPFWAIAGGVLGSLWQGAVVIGAALVGLVVVGGLLAGIKWLVLRLMPTGGLHLLRMARNNMRRRGLSLVFAMIALSIGAFTCGLALTIVYASQQEFDNRMLSRVGYNLVVLTEPGRAHTAEAAVADHVVARNREGGSHGIRYELPLAAAQADGAQGLVRALQGREVLWDVSVAGAPWGSVADGAYLPVDSLIDPARLPQTVTVTSLSGVVTTFEVVGTYQTAGSWDRYLLPAPEGILVHANALLRLGDEHMAALAAAEVPPLRLDDIAAEVGSAVPDMMVVTANDLNDGFNAAFKNLFIFAVMMAGLALIAGAVLIANAVSLAMIERRHEVGVLKATGYTRWQVLRTILLEHGLVASIAGTVGLLGVIVFLRVMTMVQDMGMAAELLHVGPVGGAVILSVTVGLAVTAALLAAWEPTTVRPWVVLRDQG